MSVLLLRTVTRKSILGFGNFKDITIQNMIDMHMERELLHIYYTCRNIDFNQDLKDELCISGEREINKKEKQEERYIKTRTRKIHESKQRKGTSELAKEGYLKTSRRKCTSELAKEGYLEASRRKCISELADEKKFKTQY